MDDNREYPVPRLADLGTPLEAPATGHPEIKTAFALSREPSPEEMRVHNAVLRKLLREEMKRKRRPGTTFPAE